MKKLLIIKSDKTAATVLILISITGCIEVHYLLHYTTTYWWDMDSKFGHIGAGTLTLRSEVSKSITSFLQNLHIFNAFRPSVYQFCKKTTSSFNFVYSAFQFYMLRAIPFARRGTRAERLWHNSTIICELHDSKPPIRPMFNSYYSYFPEQTHTSRFLSSCKMCFRTYDAQKF